MNYRYLRLIRAQFYQPAMHDSLFVQPAGGGEKYPVDTDCYTPTGEDRTFLGRKLSEQSLELFQVSGGGVDVISQIQDCSKAPNLLETQTPDKMTRIEGIAMSASFRVE
jgi:hypothetical protein